MNGHLLLKGIDTFRKTTKSTPHLLVTRFMRQQHILFPGLLHDLEHYEIFKKYLECSSETEVNYYVFETKEKSYIKNGERKTYTRTARVDKKETVNEVVKNYSVCPVLTFAIVPVLKYYKDFSSDQRNIQMIAIQNLIFLKT